MEKKKRNIIIIIALLAVIAALLIGIFALAKPILMRRMYPLDYIDEIKASSSEYGLDPYLVAAVVFAESGFKANAESPKGAYGLMQIMPSTGEWISGKLGMDSYTPDMLSKPDINIAMGCWYLNFMRERFNGDMPSVLAGYNAGHNRVGEWLDNPEYAPRGETLDVNAIPYPETKRYVQKVLSAREEYQYLYPEVFSN